MQNKITHDLYQLVTLPTYMRSYPPSSQASPDSGLFVTNQVQNLLFDGIPYKMLMELAKLAQTLNKLDIDIKPTYAIEVSSILGFFAYLLFSLLTVFRPDPG